MRCTRNFLVRTKNRRFYTVCPYKLAGTLVQYQTVPKCSRRIEATRVVEKRRGRRSMKAFALSRHHSASHPLTTALTWNTEINLPRELETLGQRQREIVLGDHVCRNSDQTNKFLLVFLESLFLMLLNVAKERASSYSPRDRQIYPLLHKLHRIRLKLQHFNMVDLVPIPPASSHVPHTDRLHCSLLCFCDRSITSCLRRVITRGF